MYDRRFLSGKCQIEKKRILFRHNFFFVHLTTDLFNVRTICVAAWFSSAILLVFQWRNKKKTIMNKTHQFQSGREGIASINTTKPKGIFWPVVWQMADYWPSEVKFNKPAMIINQAIIFFFKKKEPRTKIQKIFYGCFIVDWASFFLANKLWTEKVFNSSLYLVGISIN